MFLFSTTRRDLASRFPQISGKLTSARVYPEVLPLHGTETVVNLGCGSGPQVAIYSGRFREMFGVDVNAERLAVAADVAAYLGVERFHPINANAESTGLDSGIADAVIAVDIIEHVERPDALIDEATRLLRPGGRLLVTFPAMHDRFLDAARSLKRRIMGHGPPDIEAGDGEWNPDMHNNHNSVARWLEIISDHGLVLRRSRASTLFPPLHLFGVPRFWFNVNAIHAVDSYFCRVPGLKRLGQALVCVYELPERPNEAEKVVALPILENGDAAVEQRRAA